MEVLGYGLPLWDPSPLEAQISKPSPPPAVTTEEISASPPLEIIAGSVLYPVSRGRFDILFNAMKLGDDQAWQPRGVPDDFQALQEFAGTTERRLLSAPTLVEDLQGLTSSNVVVKTTGGEV